MGELLSVHRVSKSFGATRALVDIDHVPPDRKRGGLFPNLSVTCTLGLSHLRANSVGGFIVASRERAHTTAALRDLSVKLRSGKQNVMTLSGGNQKLPALSAGEEYLAKTGVLQKFGNVTGVS